MRSEDKKIKSIAKDTHVLRLNLKSPENRQRYPPDANDINAIQTISSEYELVLPQSEINCTSTPIITVPNVPPPPPFPPDGFLLKFSVVKDELCLPKIKNKYGAVSKNYIKKINTIFNSSQLPNDSNENFNSAKVISNDTKVKSDEDKNNHEEEGEVDEGRGSLSEKSDKNIGNCDMDNKHKNDNNFNFNHIKSVSDKINDAVNAGGTSPSNAKNGDKLPNNLDLAETIGTFTLPRIALHKTG